MRGRQYRELRWPFGGLHVGRSFHGQASDTCVDALNVRNFDPRTGRSRGAQRAGLTRYLDGASSANRIQDINQLNTVPTDTPTTSAIKQRSTTKISVCNGTVQSFTTSAFTTVTNGTTALSASAPVIYSAVLFDKMFFADGASEKYYDSTGMNAWTLTDGTFPSNGSHRPRLIEMWRARIVMSGLKGDDHNYFMSRMEDALDYDYNPTPTDVQMAVAGNNSDAGLVGDIINTMIPYDDDTLIFGCDHSIWQMSGDPAEGGRVDEISDITGMSFGRPWTKSYDGAIYFFGSRGGIYRMMLGQKPERLSSERLEEKLDTVNLDTSLVRLVYDDKTQGIHIFITPLDGTTASTHYFYDIRKDAFWPDKFANAQHNPVAVHLLDGDASTDRRVLLGGFDGRIRYIDYSSKSDDASAIESYVYLGPLMLEESRRIQLRELIGVLDVSSDKVDYIVYSADAAEAAFSQNQQQFSGTWGAGRNWSDSRRASGHALQIKVGNSVFNSTWSYETILAHLKSSGISAMRGKR